MLFPNNNDFNELKVEDKLLILDKYINLQNKKKNNLINFLNHINISIQEMSDLDNLNSSVNLLKKIKNCLDTIRDILYKLEELKKMLNNSSQEQDILNNTEKYITLLNECENLIYNNSIEIEDFILEYLENSVFVPSETVSNQKSTIKEEPSNQTNITDEAITQTNTMEEPSNQTNIIDEPIPQINTIEEPINQTTTTEEFTDKFSSVENETISLDDLKEIPTLPKDFSDNATLPEKEPEIADEDLPLTDNLVLLISEKQHKVFLPYTIVDLQNKLNKNYKYHSLQEVIDKEYTIPYEKFKNPIIARFRESYSLMKNKEKASVFDSLDLALELSFNSLLNPAVICACRNLNELDIYLDYLNSNELDKFNCFEIKYEMLPRKK